MATEKVIRKKRRTLEAKQRRYGYLFTAPFIVGGIVFIIYPVIMALIYSLTDLKIINGAPAMPWVGMENYSQAFLKEDAFRRKLLDALTEMVINVPIVVIFAFFMASILNAKFIGRGFARSIMFLPVIIATGVVAQLSTNDIAASMMSSADQQMMMEQSSVQVSSAFANMLMNMNLDLGLVNFILAAVDRIYDITVMSAVSIIIFIAGLQGISPSIYEASYIEGATKWEVFWKISFPMVSPMILLSVIYTIIDSFTASTNSVMVAINTAFTSGELGMMAAYAFSYMLIIFAVLGIVAGLISRKVFYYD